MLQRFSQYLLNCSSIKVGFSECYIMCTVWEYGDEYRGEKDSLQTKESDNLVANKWD